MELRLGRITTNCENQFEFMPARSNMEAIHHVSGLMEQYKEKNRDLHIEFIHLE